MKNKRDKVNTDFVKDGYSSEKILEIIKEIRIKYNLDNVAEISDTNKNDFKNNYKFFIERYPFLSDMAIKKDIDLDTLHYMIDLREKIITNSITFEDASKKVGNDIYQQYNEK